MPDLPTPYRDPAAPGGDDSPTRLPARMYKTGSVRVLGECLPVIWILAPLPLVGGAMRLLGVASGRARAIMALAVLAGLATVVAVMARRDRGTKAMLGELFEQIRAGDLDSASRSGDALVRRTRFGVARHWSAVWTRAMVFMLQGHFDTATELLTNLVSTRRGIPGIPAGGDSPMSALGVLRALQGNLDEAQTCLDRVSTETPDGERSSTLLLRSLILLRRGDATAAARTIDSEWSLALGSLVAVDAQRIAVVHAFASAQSNPSPGTVAAILAFAKPSQPWAFTFLGVAWPAMHAFLVEHEIARERPERSEQSRQPVKEGT